MTLEQMQKDLALQTLPDCFADLYDGIRDSWEARSAQILSADYIQNVIAESGVLTAYIEPILASAEQIRQNPAMRLWVCLLEQWLKAEFIPEWGVCKPVGDTPAHDFLHLFPALPTIPDTIADLRGRGLPEDVVADTMAEYDFCVQVCQKSLGRPVFDYSRLWWIQRIARNMLVHIGRFKYDTPGPYVNTVRVYENAAGELTVLADGMQVHRTGGILGAAGLEDTAGSFTAEIAETESAVEGYPIVNALVQTEKIRLDKTIWSLRLAPGDNVLGIHIPPGGGFDAKTMADSFDRAREIFRKCYPDFPFKGFHCRTWLLAPQLRDILKPESNIMVFQNRFVRSPYRSNGTECISFLYSTLADIPADWNDLPENTSLQRAAKQIYLDGGYIHEAEGFFF